MTELRFINDTKFEVFIASFSNFTGSAAYISVESRKDRPFKNEGQLAIRFNKRFGIEVKVDQIKFRSLISDSRRFPEDHILIFDISAVQTKALNGDIIVHDPPNDEP